MSHEHRSLPCRAVQVVFVLLLCALVCACAAPPVPRPPEPEAAEQARTAQATGNYSEAAELWRRAAAVTAGPDRNRFRLRAAESWLRAGERARSQSDLGQVEQAQLEAPEQSRYALLQAELALIEADTGRAGFYLDAARNDLPGNELDRYARLAQQLERLQADPRAFAVSAIQSALDSMGRYSVSTGVAFLQVMEDLPGRVLREISDDGRYDKDLRSWPMLALKVRDALVGVANPFQAASEWATAHPGHDVNESGFVELLDAYRSLFSLPRDIAVLLPLHGSLATAGKAIRDGLMSAYIDEPDTAGIRFYATGDAPESAISAYFSAVSDGADWIVGPLRRESVAAMVGLGGLGVPALLLNNTDDQEHTRPGLTWEMSLSQELEAHAIADRALSQGWQTAIVLASESPWGRRMNSAFTETFTAGGGTVIENSEFSLSVSDHSEMLTRVLEIDQSIDRKNRVQATLGIGLEFEPTRRDDFDFFFLAARPMQGRQIRPQLRFHDAGDKPVLAMGRIFSGEINPSADRDLDGVTFPAGRWLFEDDENALPGVSRYRADNFAALYALGADAWSILRWLPLLQKDPDLGFPGFSGTFRASSGGRLIREPDWAEFRGGRPVQIQGDS